MQPQSYTPNKPGFVERHPWRCLLIAWLVSLPLRLLATSVEVRLLADGLVVVGVVLLIVGFVQRERRAREKG